MKRKAKITRKTKETKIDVEINIDGKGNYKIKTGIGFLDHMLEQLSKHSFIDIDLIAKGDLHMIQKAYARIYFIIIFSVNVNIYFYVCFFSNSF